jgi:hypothetical protein
MSNKGDVRISSDSCTKGLKASIKVLDLVVKPWMNEIAGGSH